MGFLGNLFGKENAGNNSNDLTKTAEILDEDLYWKIVAEGLNNSDDQDSQEQFLIDRLQKLTPTEIVGFKLRTDQLLYDTYNAEMWCAGYIMNGGCSDDGFIYFRNWVISRGKDVYYKAKQNPDSLAEQIDEELDFYDFESYWYVASEAFTNKTGKDLYNYIDDNNFKYKEGNYLPFEFTWQEENPESMKAICPKLFDKMWK